jgi:nitrous oxide reductase
MGTQSRRGLLKSAAQAAAVATGGAMLGKSAEAEKSGKMEKKAYSCEKPADNIFKRSVLWESALPRGCRGAL